MKTLLLLLTCIQAFQAQSAVCPSSLPDFVRNPLILFIFKTENIQYNQVVTLNIKTRFDRLLALLTDADAAPRRHFFTEVIELLLAQELSGEWQQLRIFKHHMAAIGKIEIGHQIFFQHG